MAKIHRCSFIFLSLRAIIISISNSTPTIQKENFMRNHIKTLSILLVLAAISFVLSVAINSATLQLWLMLFGIAFSIAFFCFLIIAISKKIKPNISSYRIFAIVDGILGLCILAYALFDIATDTGWFAGLFGMLLLMFVLPIHLILLLGNFLLWKYHRRKNKSSWPQLLYPLYTIHISLIQSYIIPICPTRNSHENKT